MVTTFSDVFYTLEMYGLTDALLPFILIFTLLFAALQKTHILGEGKKNFNVIVAAVVALIVVIPHITNPHPRDAVNIINAVLPDVSLIVIAVLMMMLIIGLFIDEKNWMGMSLSGWLALIAFLIIVFIFVGAATDGNVLSNIFYYLPFDESTWTIITIILVFAILIWFITRDDSSKNKKASSAITDLGNWIRKGGN